MATPHIESKKEDIAKTVLMPGDPLRAKMVADKYLTDVKIVNTVRGMNAYTGVYKNKSVTIFPSGMGIPSMGIYSYELFKFYDVESIIRIGTVGAYTDKLKLFDIILVEDSYSKSNYALDLDGNLDHVVHSNIELNEKIIKTSKESNIQINLGNIYSTETFYDNTNSITDLNKTYNILGAEMESFALFSNARHLNKKASCLLTVSDNLITHEETTSSERQNKLSEMIELALNSI